MVSPVDGIFKLAEVIPAINEGIVGAFQPRYILNKTNSTFPSMGDGRWPWPCTVRHGYCLGRKSAFHQSQFLDRRRVASSRIFARRFIRHTRYVLDWWDGTLQNIINTKVWQASHADWTLHITLSSRIRLHFVTTCISLATHGLWTSPNSGVFMICQPMARSAWTWLPNLRRTDTKRVLRPIQTSIMVHSRVLLHEMPATFLQEDCSGIIPLKTPRAFLVRYIASIAMAF